MPTRTEMWEKLGEPVDLLVVGAGITGSGIARDAARRGLKVAVVDMNDVASGTSSRSSKLVHGGLRYLEHYEFSLVFEAVSERRILMDIAPHLVNPLGFLFPVYEGSRHNLWLINAGMWLYDGLSLFRSPRIHRKLKPDEVAREEPAVRQDGLKGAPLYFDCSTDDARLTLETALDAAKQGATVATWCRVQGFLKSDAGRLSGAIVKDGFTGALKEIQAHAVINATGPWTDRTLAMARPMGADNLLRTTKGIHIVVDHDKLPLTHAVVCMHPHDERVLFAIPWDDRTYIGTTDTDYDDDPGDVVADRDDVIYLIRAANTQFPNHRIEEADVIATWAGIRPLIAPATPEGEVSESSVSREHHIAVGQDGLITIAGGKLTTYRRMAGEVVDTAVRLLELSGQIRRELREAATDKHPLPGGVGWPADDDHGAVAKKVLDAGGGVIPTATARYLADTYGMRALDIAKLCRAEPRLAEPLEAGRPEILAQVRWSVEQELAATVSDVLIRRTQVFFRSWDQGLKAAEVVAAEMAALLAWDDERRASELASYQSEVSRARGWKG